LKFHLFNDRGVGAGGVEASLALRRWYGITRRGVEVEEWRNAESLSYPDEMHAKMLTARESRQLVGEAARWER
jgi:hypothetical protein